MLDGTKEMTDGVDKNTRTAIFIDGDWLCFAARHLKEEVDYARLKVSLDDCFGTEAPMHFFCSINAQQNEQQQFVRTLKSLGYIVHVSKLRRQKDRYGNITLVSKGLDVALAVSAMALPDEFRTLVLFSGDSDFLSLVKTARSQGREVILITVPLASRELVEASGKKYINLEALLRNLKQGKGIPRIRPKKAVSPKNMYVEKGDHFAPYLFVRSLFLSAQHDIVLIDPYVDDQILQMIPLLPKTVSITLLSSKISPADFCVQVNKLRKDGYEIHVFLTKAFHDRFLGVDDQWWHSGHSFKDLGGKDSFFSQIDDSASLAKLRQRVKSEISKGTEYCI